ncbi:LacI family DNA-binding transcriptional regulator [Microbacterium betulae]|uniref:LacI family DNA-binding transcriptional regulator n=1 Tax=Microbacterium betulae TaxID=2981139 RepID=A0AA97I693_9MICO|nr:LacI family DNA-binding transcriptional regulator [Microbacterium sp. AB]WOF22382.1 LacI family DNA-binding transcriptional regulator [Microbacterium sp. AB]
MTLSDVAGIAGVSVGTVSKVMNGTGQLRPATRVRVMKAARTLGFRPSFIRHDPGLAELLTIGVVTSDSYGRFTIPLMLGAEDAFGPGQVSVLMCDARDDPVREDFYIRFLVQRRVDGVIVTGKSTDPRPSLGRDFPFPVLYAYQPSEDPADSSIVPDHAGVAETAVERLLAIGRERIVHITGPLRQTVVRERIRGTVDTLARHGLGLVDEPLSREWSERWGREAVCDVLTRGLEVDGVFCASDELARGAVTGLRESGVRVPDEVAVVGVDNWSVLAEAARPPLTTVDLELGRLGVRAAQMLEDAIRGRRPLPRGVHTLPGTLVVRESA